jgi:hypothetical protein
MSARKSWRTESWPGCIQTPQDSQAGVYRYIQRLRDAKAAGMLRTTHVVVKVREAGSSKWETFERVDL